MFTKGMRLAEAAERIAPIVGLPAADKVAAFVILVITDDEGSGPVVAASENVPPAVAAILLQDAGRILAQTVAKRSGECN